MIMSDKKLKKKEKKLESDRQAFLCNFFSFKFAKKSTKDFWFSK